MVNALAKEADVKWKSDRLAFVAEIKLKGKPIILIQPTTYMNLSGKSIQYWLQAEKIQQENLMVITDDLALPFGKIRIRPKGSDGGHNGLKSIQELIGENYNRLRFGVGNNFNKGQQSDYVLSKWDEEENKSLNEKIDLAVKAIKAFTFIGLERTMNEFNSK